MANSTSLDIGSTVTVLAPTNKSMWRDILETKEAGQVDQIFDKCHQEYIHPLLRPLLGCSATIFLHNFPRGLVTENTGVPDTISLYLANPGTYFLGGFLRGWLIRDSEEEKELFGWIDSCYTQDWYKTLSALNWVRDQKKLCKEDDDVYVDLDSLERALFHEFMGKVEEERETPKLTLQDLVKLFAYGIEPKDLEEYEVEGFGKIGDKIEMYQRIYEKIQENLEKEKSEKYSQQYGEIPASPYAPYQFLGGLYVSYEEIFKALKEYVEKIENTDEEARKYAAKILEEAGKYMGASALENYSNFGKYLAGACSKIYKTKENE